MQNQSNNVEKLNEFNREYERGKEGKLKAKSNDKLVETVRKKLQTAFIGAISQFEQSEFGRLWGYGLSADKCTANQLKWREIWNDVRNRILNNGNNQVRAMESELDKYEVAWKMHKNQFNAEGCDKEKEQELFKKAVEKNYSYFKNKNK